MDYLLNVEASVRITGTFTKVLNLIINGLPSKPGIAACNMTIDYSFKPYYKWITF